MQLISLARRPVRALATKLLALALLAGIGGAFAPSANAQLGVSLPSPVAAGELESLLRAAGADEALLAIALPLHEGYFTRFREFEEREVDESMKRATSPLDTAPSVEDAKRTADMRRRIFARAAQIDAELVDEIVGLLTPEAAAKAEKLRGALTRRRAVAAIPNMGFARGAHAFDLRSAPALASLDEASRAAIAPTFASYELELTRQLERLADASFARRVRAAEAREELGVSAFPQAPAEGAANAAEGDAQSQWMQQMQEVQRRAGEEMARIDAGIRRLHRDTLNAVATALPPAQASAMRSYLVSEVYMASALSGGFDAVRKAAENQRAKGELDDARWEEIVAVIRAHDSELAPELNAFLDMLDRDAARGTGVMFGAAEAREEIEAINAARERCNDIIARQEGALRAALGTTPNDASRAITTRDIQMGGGMTVTGGVQIAVMGGDGEAIALGMDDLADSGMMLGGMFGGGGGRVPRPMSGDELDRLAERLGFGRDTRAIFDEIVARASEARNAAEEADRAASAATAQPMEDGAISMTLTIGEDGGMTVGESGPADAEKLMLAIAAAEERMFDELKAVVEPTKEDATEAARRARARTRLLVDERGPQSADVVAIVESAPLDDAQRAAIADEVRTWDESSVSALQAMRDVVSRANEERGEILERASRTEETDSGDGNTQVARTMQIDEEMSNTLQSLDQRIREARDAVVRQNRSTIDALATRLEAYPAAATAIRRGIDRTLEPGAYRASRDLEPFFSRAVALEGLRPETRTAIATIRAEWIESREALCEAFVVEREKERAAASGDGAASFASFGAKAQARKRLTADLEQLETSAVRRLRDLLTIEFGAEKAASIGELAPRRARNTPMLEIGGSGNRP
jgi:hypothetical protein